MLSRIPIFIVARGNNELKYQKNHEALKYSYVFISNMSLLEQTYIISDNKQMLEYAKRLGFKHTFYQECKNINDLRYLEYNAICNFHITNNYEPDWFIILSIDGLFVNSKLISECIKHIDYNYDVITSYTEISDRSKFLLDDNFKLESGVKRITNDKQRRKMADSTIYAIKSSFAKECMQSEDPAIHFWEGKFIFFKNPSLLTDIYEYEDITKFSYIGDIIEKVKQININ